MLLHHFLPNILKKISNNILSIKEAIKVLEKIKDYKRYQDLLYIITSMKRMKKNNFVLSVLK